MISVIYGAKGSGKTKRIIEAANAAGEKALGQVVFITDNERSLAVNAGVRFVNIKEYDVKSCEEFVGFIKGMLATDFDIQTVFIDGLSRLLSKPAEELKPVFDELAKAQETVVNFVLTVSGDALPDYLKKYAVKD